MCEYISSEFFMPGYGCCKCGTYNGLQRDKCKNCKEVHHELMIPDDVVRCPLCGFGMIKNQDIVGDLIGRDLRGKCPNCLFNRKRNENLRQINQTKETI